MGGKAQIRFDQTTGCFSLFPRQEPPNWSPHLKLIIVSTNHFLLPDECTGVNSLHMLPAGELEKQGEMPD